MTATESAPTSRAMYRPSAAMGIRPAIIPAAVYLGSAINNASTIFTTLPPWIYLGTALILLGFSLIAQWRQGTAWNWPVAIAIGFAIALVAWLVAIVITNAFAPGQITPA